MCQFDNEKIYPIETKLKEQARFFNLKSTI